MAAKESIFSYKNHTEVTVMARLLRRQTDRQRYLPYGTVITYPLSKLVRFYLLAQRAPPHFLEAEPVFAFPPPT
jgi:hypothetical protein